MSMWREWELDRAVARGFDPDDHEPDPAPTPQALSGMGLASHLISDHRRMPAMVWQMTEAERLSMHSQLHDPNDHEEF